MLRLEISINAANHEDAQQEVIELGSMLTTENLNIEQVIGPTYRYSSGLFDACYAITCRHNDYETRSRVLDLCDLHSIYVRSCDKS